jgi:nitroreductase
MPRSLRARTHKIMLNDDIMRQIDGFRKEFKDGSIPVEYLMTFLILLGIYSYRRGVRMGPEIKLGEMWEMEER